VLEQCGQAGITNPTPHIFAVSDPELYEEVLRTMRAPAHNTMTIIVVTYEARVATEVANMVIFMDGGLVIGERVL
jgi:ABC-type polar amino acid transport system ATPase subunit